MPSLTPLPRHPQPTVHRCRLNRSITQNFLKLKVRIIDFGRVLQVFFLSGRLFYPLLIFKDPIHFFVQVLQNELGFEIHLVGVLRLLPVPLFPPVLAS